MSTSGNGPGAFMAQPLKPGRIAVCALLLVLGVVVGTAGALVQGGWFPGGLLLALLGVAGLCYGGARLTGTRAGGLSAGAGWLLSAVLLMTRRPEGDLLVLPGVGSYVYLLGGMALAVMCATVAVPPQPVVASGRLGK